MIGTRCMGQYKKNPTEMEKSWLISSADNLEIHNDGINTFTRANGSSIIGLVLTN